MPNKKLRDLIKHFNKYRLRNEDFEFPDLLGAAYEYLIGEFAESAGKKGGEFYTPRDVVRLMVRLIKPQEGMRVYDPCCGSGGMLIHSHEYVEECGGNIRNLSLYGQDNNGGVWAICKMNMLLHGIQGADIHNEDVITSPSHKEGGELMRFDRVITNPPFSQDYTWEGIDFTERFIYGRCPESGKKADLMFLQHMLAVLRTGGMMATVMPHGVLFRGGAEKTIRKRVLEHDLLEAVIGLPPNLFYGTGIPACILVCRTPGGKSEDRKGKVLFINADAEYHAGRAQNHIRPEHVEKIVSCFEAFDIIPGYSAVATLTEIEDNDWNLNIRRYADNAPPPEPQNVRAHILGGVPKTEVADKQDLLEAHGLAMESLFTDRDDTLYDFIPALDDRGKIRTVIESDAGVLAKEDEMWDVFSDWWEKHEGHIAGLHHQKALRGIRGELIDSFTDALVPVGILDRFKAAGMLASWWNDLKYDFKTLMAQGFEGLIDSWVNSLEANLEDEKENGRGQKFNPTEEPFVVKLMPEYIQELETVQERISELEAEKEVFESGEDADDFDPDEAEEGETLSYAVYLKTAIRESKDSVKDDKKRVRILKGAVGKKGSIRYYEKNGEDTRKLKRELKKLESRILPIGKELERLEEALKPYQEILENLKEARKHFKVLKERFVEFMQEARGQLLAEDCQEIALEIMQEKLQDSLERYMTAHRQEVIGAMENWWDKYHVTLRDIGARKAIAVEKAEAFMATLGYSQ